MNKSGHILSAFLPFAILLVSCRQELDESGNVPSPVPGSAFTLVAHSENQSKVTLQDDYSVLWDRGDSLSLLYPSGASKLVTSESGTNAAFSGSVPEGTSLSDAVALFPYDTAAAIQSGSVNTRFPHNQIVSNESGKNLSSPMLGAVEKRESSFYAEMKHIGGLLEFELGRTDISSVVFCGNGEEWLSGNVSVMMSCGEPVVLRKEKTSGCTEIAVLPGAQVFSPGLFRAVVPETSFACGITAILFTADGKMAKKTSTEPFSVKRAHIKPLGTIDEGLEWTDIPSDTLKLQFHGSWPFTEHLPAGSYTTSPAFIDEVHDFYTEDGKRFTIYARKGLAYLSSVESFKIQGLADDYIIFPSITGKCLTDVRIKTGREGTMRIPSIRSEDGSSVVDGGYPLSYPFPDANSEFSWHLYGTSPGTRYRLNFECSGYYDNKASAVVDYSACIQEIELVYSALPKVNPSPRVWRDVENNVPDFSRVGYRYGDRAIPDYPVGLTLDAPGDDSDCTQMIQDAIDRVHPGMAVLLNEGTYCIRGEVVIRRSNVVLRGSGEKTVLLAAGDRTEASNNTVIRIDSDIPSVTDWTSVSPVVENAGCGQMYVKVGHPDLFVRGDRVLIGRMPFQKWTHDLKMDNILDTLAGRIPYQELPWKPQSFLATWERTVVSVDGDKLYFENPLVMSLTSDYCSAYVVKTMSMRNSEVGIENLKIKSEYDDNVRISTSKWALPGGPKWYYADENHAWYAIVFRHAEHCWVKNVTGEHFAMGVVDMNSGAKNITVTDCKSLNPVSELIGSRRYAFYIRKGQLCLVRNCEVEKDRHAFVNGTMTSGPNVYSRCSATAMCAEVGPHQYWATGTLFDCVSSDNDICLHDRAGRGGSSKTAGQGWAAANCVLWNCTMQSSPYSGVSGSIVCQSPWVSAKNWAFGCGPSYSIKPATIPYFDGLVRPEGEWASKGVPMTAESLYETQRAARTSPALDLPNMPEGYCMDDLYHWQ